MGAPAEHLDRLHLEPAKFFDGQSGYGYAYGAEWYFNFGFPGMLLGMMFTGWLTGFFRNNSCEGRSGSRTQRSSSR